MAQTILAKMADSENNLLDPGAQECESSDPIKFETGTETNLVLVLQPGSANLRIGRITDTTPEVIPHVIAYKQTNSGVRTVDETLLFNLEQQNETFSDARKEIFGIYLRQLEDIRPDTCNDKLRGMNHNIIPTVLKTTSEITSTNFTNANNFYIGEDALHISNRAPYNIHWPIRRGRFNRGQPLEMVLQCLEDIWREVVTELCDTREFGDVKVVLLIPDLFERQEVKCMVDVLLNRLKFGSVAIQQSSVCAIYSSGFISGCVVDVGDQSVSVCCVEDGISNPNTRMALEYGGNDITRAFWWLLKQAGFPYKEWSIEDRIDRCLMDELKEDLCHLDMELRGVKEYSFDVNPPDANKIQFKMFLCDEVILAPLAFFYPSFITMVTGEHVRSQKIQPSHPEDYLDDVSLFETKNITGMHIDEQETELQLPLITKLLNSKSIGGADSSENLLSLDEAIHLSINCANEQNKQKLYKNIVVTGAGFQFQKSVTFLQNRLRKTLPSEHKNLQVDILTPPREGEISKLSWLGGRMLSSLDASNEIWITREEWMCSGVRLIRERSPFLW